MSEKIKDGPFKEYHENGQLKREGVYKDGKLDGSVKNYHKERITSDEDWENGRIVNFKEITYYGDSRQIYQEVTYVHFFDGGPCISGPFKTYYQNGRLKEEGMTCELSQDKHQLPSYESDYRWEIENDRVKPENYGWDDMMYNHPPIDEDGFLEEQIKLGLFGTYRKYYENGQLWKEEKYNGGWGLGRLDGPYIVFNEKGELKEEGTFKDGELIDSKKY